MNNNSIELLDLLTIISFALQISNLNANLNQNDKQELMNEVDSKTEKILRQIEKHLEIQDEKIDKIMRKLNINEEE